MNINTDYLKALLTTIETGSFTRAATVLGLTQSALSQKIARLESQLEATLLIRSSEGLKLTASGERVLVHARQQLQLEEEFLRNFNSGEETLAGSLRIAGFSSVMRSLVIPKLAPWLRANKGITMEFSSHEVHELPEVLKSNRADLVITDYHPHLPGVLEEVIGEEEYVIIESRKHKNVPEVFLDHYPMDNATEAFFTHQGEAFRGKRSYMGDVYGILDGVALGLGKAVMSKHLVENDARFKILPSRKRYKRPIVLNTYQQAYYPAIQREAREILRNI